MKIKLINDEMELKNFISLLPELKDEESYYLTLLSRVKYHKGGNIIPNKYGVKRFMSNKPNLINKIKELQLEGNYYYNNSDEEIPEDSLCLYINLNPRSNSLATKELTLELVREAYEGHNIRKKRSSNPLVSKCMNLLSTSISRTIHLGFDFDTDESTNKKELLGDLRCKLSYIINDDSYYIVETKGGFHLVIIPSKINNKLTKTKSWYNKIISINKLDVKGDMLLPIPGCYQGGFIPKVIRNE